MKIARIVIPSTMDELGRSSATLFSAGCNLDCKFCHNHDLIRYTGSFIPAESIIEQIKKSVVISCIVITGGEPTIHDDVCDFSTMLKEETGLDVYMNTNGTRPEVVERLLAVVKGIAMDVKTSFATYPAAITGNVDTSSIIRSFDRLIEASNDIKIEFRTTVVNPFSGKKDVLEIASELEAKRFNGYYALQQYDPSQVRPPWNSTCKACSTSEMIEIASSIKKCPFKVFVRTFDRGIVKINF